jgi:ribosomal protein S9
MDEDLNNTPGAFGASGAELRGLLRAVEALFKAQTYILIISGKENDLACQVTVGRQGEGCTPVHEALAMAAARALRKFYGDKPVKIPDTKLLNSLPEHERRVLEQVVILIAEEAGLTPGGDKVH